jgi:hypothetical protein
VNKGLRLRNSVAAEAFLIALVYVGGTIVWRRLLALRAGVWYASAVAGGSPRLAGL